MSSGSSVRIIPNRPRVLPGVPHSTYSPDAGSHLTSDLRPTETLCPQVGDLISLEDDPRAPDRLACFGAVFPCPLQTGPDSLRDPDPLLLGDPGCNGEHELTGGSSCSEVRFRDADETDAITS